MSDDFLSVEDADAILEAFPSIHSGRPRVPREQLVLESGPLTREHVTAALDHEASGSPMDITKPGLKSIRPNHHRLAQLLAQGMEDTKAAVLCNYSPGRVLQLKAEPAFANLIDYYRGSVAEEWQDFVSAAANLSMDFVHRLHEMLEENPAQFSPSQVLESIKTLADRSGNAPVNKNQNINLNVNLGDRLASARKRANALLLEGTFRED